jgi:hypothetical protein
MDVTLTECGTEITRRLAEPALDPMTAWRALKPNSLIWARWWLENGGELPASCHHAIVQRLLPWIAAVTAGGPEMRDALLAAVPPIPPREPEPTRIWIMPAVGKTYSMERESDEEEQIDVRSGAEVVQVPEKPLSAGPGGVTPEPGESDPLDRRYASGRRCRCVSTPRRHQGVRVMRKGVQAIPSGDVILFLGVSAAGVPQAAGGMIPARIPGSTI